jgi:hypothetical protein
VVQHQIKFTKSKGEFYLLSTKTEMGPPSGSLTPRCT